MIRVAIVDSGLSNLHSVARAIEVCGGTPVVTREAEGVTKAHRVILPGVGAFPDAMAALRRRGLDEAICDAARTRAIPVLGICLGMQLLASGSVEVAPTEGLDLVPGRVVPIQPESGERVPHIGWNEVRRTREDQLLKGVQDGADVYFVHSFELVPDDDADVLLRTSYGGGIVAAVQRGNVRGVQFHPEKSQRIGLAMLDAFVHQVAT